MLDQLRYASEIRSAESLKVPEQADLDPREIDLALTLVNQLTDKWQPEKYHDEYRDDLMKIIGEKVESGKTKVVETAMPAAPREQRGKVIDIMHLLRESVEQASKRGERKDEAPRRRKAS
jgi:DNA end-binding protein Ku